MIVTSQVRRHYTESRGRTDDKMSLQTTAENSAMDDAVVHVVQ